MRKHNRGQKLDIKANDWNRLCDLAGQGIGQAAGSGARLNPHCIWVKNTLDAILICMRRCASVDRCYSNQQPHRSIRSSVW